MTIGLITFEIHLPAARSLKDKRQVVRRLKDRLRSRFNVAVIEREDHADLRQRARLAVVSLSDRRERLDSLFESLRREVESQLPGQIIDSGRDWIETSDEGYVDWREDDGS